MSRTVFRVTPVGSFDIPGRENWIAAMADRGLRYSMTIGRITFFEWRDKLFKFIWCLFMA